MVDPDDRDEYVADEIADSGRPQAEQRPDPGRRRRVEFQYRDGDHHREDGIGVPGDTLGCAEPLLLDLSLLAFRSPCSLDIEYSTPLARRPDLRSPTCR